MTRMKISQNQKNILLVWWWCEFAGNQGKTLAEERDSLSGIVSKNRVVIIITTMNWLVDDDDEDDKVPLNAFAIVCSLFLLLPASETE